MIKKFKKEDTEVIMEIWKESAIRAHNFISDSYWLENYENVKNNYLPNSTTYIYEEDGEIKGFASILEGEFIGGLFVKINSQRRGIGSEIIKFLKEKYEKLQLAVYDKNIGALNFYLRSDFEVINSEIDEKTKEKEHLMEWKR